MIQPKSLLALAGAWVIGVWCGLNWLALTINPLMIAGQTPDWVGLATQISLASVGAFGLCVVAWIILDIREHGIDLEVAYDSD